ncbi:hypothetical protein G6549_16685 [Bacillus sp. MM2020_1]|nr:hypothetical protein [Bacillus sp. MM2020_1]
MWVMTIYSKGNEITMFEFNTEKEAREAFKKVRGCKILSEVIYFNDDSSSLTLN